MELASIQLPAPPLSRFPSSSFCSCRSISFTRRFLLSYVVDAACSLVSGSSLSPNLSFMPSSCSHGYLVSLSIFQIIRAFHLIDLCQPCPSCCLFYPPPPFNLVMVHTSFFPTLTPSFPCAPFPSYLDSEGKADRQVVMATANRYSSCRVQSR